VVEVLYIVVTKIVRLYRIAYYIINILG